MDTSLPSGIDLATIPVASPPPGVTSNFVNPESLAPTIIAVSVASSVLCLLQLSARIYGAIRITRSPGLDDCAVVLAFGFSMAYTGLVLSTRQYARHSWDMSIADFSASYLKILLVENYIGAFALLLSKLSILLLLFRLFSPNRRTRYMIYLGIFWAAVTSLGTLIVASVLCAPRHGEAFESPAVISRCEHEKIWAVVQSTMSAVLDLYILYLPIPMVWSLKLNRKRKIGVLSIFMTGLM